jgi:hypothetical protein
VRLPDQSSQPFSVALSRDARFRVDLHPQGAATVPVELDAGRAVYRGSYSHTDVI